MPIKEVEGQCGTCRFADCFDYGPSPSGPEDGVHCTSEDYARRLDEISGAPECYNQKELQEHGYLDLFRLEVLEEEDYTCPDWEPSEEWLARQIPPEVSGH